MQSELRTMATFEKRNEKVMELLELMQKHPDLKIVPRMITNGMEEHVFGRLLANWGDASVEEVYYSADGMRFIRSKDETMLIEELAWSEKFSNGLSEEEAIKKATNGVKNYGWETVIVVEVVL